MKYKKLTQRDIIQKDDEYRTNWGTWEQIEPEFVGKRKGSVFSWTLKMRRPLWGYFAVGVIKEGGPCSNCGNYIGLGEWHECPDD